MRRHGWRAALLATALLMALALLIGSCGGDRNPIVPGDTTAPAATILAIGTVTTTTVELTWTAPGDDGITGTAGRYDIRYSTATITPANFTSATAVTGAPTPAVAGTSQRVTVSELIPNTPYYFALKTADEVPNWSLISNLPSGTTSPSPSPDITPPSAVVNLAAGTPTETSLTLTWTAVGDDGGTGTATSYDLRYSTAAITAANFAAATPVTDEPAPHVAGTAESMTVSGLASSTTYYFALKVADEVPNWSVISNLPSGTTLPLSDSTPPSAVANLAAGTPTPTSLTLTWTAVGDDGGTGTATSYDLRYSTAAITAANFAAATPVTGEPAPHIAGTAESMTVSGLASSTTYYFALKVADEVPNWSLISNLPSGTTSPSPDSTPPSAVANLAAGTPTPTALTLTWTAVGDDGGTGTATSYDLRYSTAAITAANFASATPVTGEPAPHVAGTAESMTVSGLASNTTYYFALKVADEVPNWSVISNLPSGTTSASPDITPPSAVANLAAETPTETSLPLTWTAVGDDGNTGTATSYDLRYATTAITAANFAAATPVTGEPAPQVAGTAESMTVSGLASGTTYYFALKVADEVPNWSVISNLVSATTLPAGPDLPTVPVPPLEHAVDLCSNDPVAIEIQDEVLGQIESARGRAASGRSFLDDMYSPDWTPGSGDCYTREDVTPSCTYHYQTCPVGDGLECSLTLSGTWLGQPVENWTIWSGHISSDGLSGTTSIHLSPSLPESFMTSTWQVAADGKSGEYKWYNGPADPSVLLFSMNFEEQVDGTFEVHWEVASAVKWDLAVSADGKSGTYDWYMIDYAGGGGWTPYQHTEWADCHGSRTSYDVDPPKVETW